MSLPTASLHLEAASPKSFDEYHVALADGGVLYVCKASVRDQRLESDGEKRHSVRFFAVENAHHHDVVSEEKRVKLQLLYDTSQAVAILLRTKFGIGYRVSDLDAPLRDGVIFAATPRVGETLQLYFAPLMAKGWRVSGVFPLNLRHPRIIQSVH